MKNIFKQGFTQQLVIIFSLAILIPSLLIGATGYKLASDGLLSEATQNIKIVSVAQKNALNAYVKELIRSLNFESRLTKNIHFLQQLIEQNKSSGLTTQQYVNTKEWKKTVAQYSHNLVQFNKVYNYKDTYLIDRNGAILYNDKHPSLLGESLFKTAELSASTFAQSVKRAKASQQTIFSGFFNATGHDGLIGFFIHVIKNKSGEIIGFLAIEDSIKKYEKILQFVNYELEAESYLINQQGDPLTFPYTTDQHFDRHFKMDEDKVLLWLAQEESTERKINSSFRHEYLGIKGKQVIGQFQKVDVAGVQYALVSELDATEIYKSSNTVAMVTLFIAVIILFLALFIILPIIRSIIEPILGLEKVVSKVAAGDINSDIDIQAKHEIKYLIEGFQTMLSVMKLNQKDVEAQEWHQEGVAKFNDLTRGELSVAELSRNIILFLCEYFGAQVGAFYTVKDKTIKLTGSYAFTHRKSFKNEFAPGEGMVGQAVLEKQPLVILNVPEGYLPIGSGLGEITPKVLSIIPILWDNRVTAVIEIGSLKSFNNQQEKLLEALNISISVAINSALSREQALLLLKQTQAQSEELQTREEELRESNSLLEKSASDLEEKNNELQAQQEELRAANEELEVKAKELEDSGQRLEEKNSDLDFARLELEKKAADLAQSSKYKSEFLANMSHELRTPLNSLLILAKLLADNRQKNLDEKQVEYASTIHESGTDLLNLINDILDLSKIEAGRMDVLVENISIQDLADTLQRKFQPISDKKGIELQVVNQLNDETIKSDKQKLSQIIKNLMSNAIKFTETGSVSLIFSPLEEDFNQHFDKQLFIQISVKDTGIGLAQDKLKSIFDAFKQADGTTSRKYGGTGLGLSISRELSKLLGGDIIVSSVEGEGSRFTLLIKRSLSTQTAIPEFGGQPTSLVDQVSTETTSSMPLEQNRTSAQESINLQQVKDDRHTLSKTDKSILIIEDDFRFASVLTGIAHDSGYKVLVAEDGETGLYFADYYQPDGIILDIGLPGINGHQVLERLKARLSTRHIPVHFMSGQDKSLNDLQSGAIGYLTKPISEELLKQSFAKIEHFTQEAIRKLLLIEDDDVQRSSLIELLADDDIEVVEACSGEQALQLLKEQHFDCIVLDLGLPDISGAELLEQIKITPEFKEIPVVVYSGKELNREEKELLDTYASRIIIKNARSPERLLDETALFLHRVESNLSADKQATLKMMHDSEAVLQNKHVLVADDDMRNVFALTTLLREQKMQVTSAKNGIDALQKLDEMEQVDLILMDIMMPEMDGYEAMQKIRAQDQYKATPMIALTAKAMKGDRAKCIKAGASDYLSKPIDSEKLLSMLRVWLYR